MKKRPLVPIVIPGVRVDVMSFLLADAKE